MKSLFKFIKLFFINLYESFPLALQDFLLRLLWSVISISTLFMLGFFGKTILPLIGIELGLPKLWFFEFLGYGVLISALIALVAGIIYFIITFIQHVIKIGKQTFNEVNSVRTVNVGEEFSSRLCTATEADQFRSKFMPFLDDRSEWKTNTTSIILDFSDVEVMYPTFVERLFLYYIIMGDAKQILKKIKLVNISKINQAMIDVELGIKEK